MIAWAHHMIARHPTGLHGQHHKIAWAHHMKHRQIDKIAVYGHTMCS